MGLDVTAYPTAIELPEHDYFEGTAELAWADSCSEQGHERPGADEGFEATTRGLKLTARHASRYGGFYLTGPCYQVDRERGFHFRAGSYSGYNRWRAELAKAVIGVEPEQVWKNPNGYADAPFFELVHFTDCDGTIGGEAAADLARDFVEWGEKVVPALMAVEPEHSDWYRSKYEAWAKACKLAAGSGLISLH